MIRVIRLHGTTDSLGDATIASDLKVTGLLHAVEWTDGDTAAGVDFVLSQVRDNDAADITLLTATNANADAVYYPRVAANDGTGGTIAGEYDRLFINGKLKLVIDEGGDTKSGGVTVYYEV